MESILATEYLNLDYQEFKTAGVFDPILTKDSPFFINVIRLKRAQTPEFNESYTRINQYFSQIATILENAESKDRKDKFFRAAISKFEVFREVNGINLGFAQSVSGAGFGPILSTQVISDAFDIVKKGIRDPEVFHLIGLFEENVGPDRLSDMIATIILPDIIAYTKRIQSQFGICKEHYPEYDFDDNGFLINPFKNCPLFFLPEEILHELPIAHDCEDVDRVVTENTAIRNELNTLIGNHWADWVRTSASYKKDYLKKNIFMDRQSCQRVIESYRDTDLDPIDFNNDFEYGLKKLWQSISPQFNLSFLQHSNEQIDSLTGARTVVDYFKDWVENNSGWEVILTADSKKREKLTQRLIHLCAKKFIDDNDLDFSCEPDNGHGPVDFKISRGSDKTVIELKLSSNPQYMHGYKEQIRLYAKSEGTDKMIYVLVDVGNPGRVQRLEAQVMQDEWLNETSPEVVIIDSTEQVSASIW